MSLRILKIVLREIEEEDVTWQMEAKKRARERKRAEQAETQTQERASIEDEGWIQSGKEPQQSKGGRQVF